MQDKPVVLLGHPVIGRAPQLPPGTYTGRIIAIDMARGEDHMAGILAKISAGGALLIESIWQMDNLIKLKPHSWEEMINPELFKSYKPQHSLRNRHYKRKQQPNRGPVGRNQW